MIVGGLIALAEAVLFAVRTWNQRHLPGQVVGGHGAAHLDASQLACAIVAVATALGYGCLTRRCSTIDPGVRRVIAILLLFVLTTLTCLAVTWMPL